MHRTFAAVLGAVTIVAALGLSGCSDDTSSAPSPTPVPLTKPPTVSPSPAEAGAPLPSPTALADVMGRLADPAIPGPDKVGLVQNGTPADGAALDRFAKALHDSGYAPVTVDATDLMWASDQQGNVIANVTMKPGGPAATDKTLKFPMEFSPQADAWQLTRQTADLLLQIDPQPTAKPTP
ncbi:hypothetical protein C8E89_108110 [Mycolicibacterium moriokaense]|uniref:Low molecular weight antigen MTB12-like C-terminal domain-containing protein n=1 Tax=Mycolicibacterium moriokaense TaxID=39691 RepID=A0A318HGD0_9MYCO|nr:hypothetical protein C8E89_108110 [Mycolicibacterium moriokaense]